MIEKNSKLPKWAIIVIVIAFLLNISFVIFPGVLILFGLYMAYNLDIFMDKKGRFLNLSFLLIYV